MEIELPKNLNETRLRVAEILAAMPLDKIVDQLKKWGGYVTFAEMLGLAGYGSNLDIIYNVISNKLMKEPKGIELFVTSKGLPQEGLAVLPEKLKNMPGVIFAWKKYIGASQYVYKECVIPLPPIEQLAQELQSHSYCSLSTKYGCGEVLIYKTIAENLGKFPQNINLFINIETGQPRTKSKLNKSLMDYKEVKKSIKKIQDKEVRFNIETFGRKDTPPVCYKKFNEINQEIMASDSFQDYIKKNNVDFFSLIEIIKKKLEFNPQDVEYITNINIYPKVMHNDIQKIQSHLNNLKSKSLQQKNPERDLELSEEDRPKPPKPSENPTHHYKMSLFKDNSKAPSSKGKLNPPKL